VFLDKDSKLLPVDWEEHSNQYGTHNNGGQRMAQTGDQINTTKQQEEAKIEVRWIEEICDTLDEKGLEGQRMDSALWWLGMASMILTA
jgi:hypothetical protein